MNFFQSTSSPNESQYIPITDAITTTMANENNENEEDSSSTNLNRIVLDLYEKDGKTPKIQLVDNDVIIQPEDILVGFVGLTGRGKSQLLRCLTSNEVFSSGDRPTTYMATGKLCIFNNNHRYWLIDTPGHFQATEPENHYFYKKWIDSSYDTSFDHRLKDENGHKYEEVKLTSQIVTKYINDLIQKLHLCVFVFDNRVDQQLKDYYNENIIKYLGTRSRVIFARTKWDAMYLKSIEARKKTEETERDLLIETFELDSNRARIVFTTGLIDNEVDYDQDRIKDIRSNGFNIDNLKQMIDETMNDHGENLQIEKKAMEDGLPLRLSELKEGDHILYFPTLNTKIPYSALIAINQNDNIQVYARTPKFINNIRQADSLGTEYHYFSFNEFRRSTFDKVDETVPDDYVQDPPIIIRQLYKNSTKAEQIRTLAIEEKHPQFRTKHCDFINSDGHIKTLARARSVIKNTNGTDEIPFRVFSTADYAYTCKTGQQPPLDKNFWTTYNLSSLSELTAYSARAFGYFAHLSLEGATKSICHSLGRYPFVDVVICAANCYQEPRNKYHYVSKAVAGGVISTAICFAAPLLAGPAAPFVIAGGMIVGGELGNAIGGRFFKWQEPKNENVIKFSEDNTE